MKLIFFYRFSGIIFFFVFSLTAQAQMFTEFRFQRVATGLEYSFPGIIDHDNHIITVRSEKDRTQGWIENIAKLPATFTLDGDYTVKVGDVVQVSGVTENDFRRIVVYTINENVQYTVILEHPQTSGLPVIHIGTQNGAPIADRENWVPMAFSLTDPNHPENDFSKTDFFDQIRGRGNATWEPNKKPYRMRFRENTSLFGLPAARNWVLLAEYYDVTLIKNTFAFELGERLGLPYNHTYQHVELFLNGKYRGTYVLTEHNQVDTGRVDIDRTDGWLVEIDFHFDALVQFRTGNYNLPVIIHAPDLGKSLSAYTFLVNEWDGLCNLMTSEGFPENGYRDLIDMETFINYFLVQTIVASPDFDNPGSTFFYRDKGGKISAGPLWDLKLGFGFNWINRPQYMINTPNAIYPADKYMYPQHRFFRRFFDDPVFLIKWKENWMKNLDIILSMSQYIDEMSDKIKKSAKENYKNWWTNYPVDYDYWIGEMKSFLEERISYLHRSYNEVILLPAPPKDGSDFVLKPAGNSNELPTQTFTLVGYGEISDLSAIFRSGNTSPYEITDFTQTATGNGGFLVTVDVKPKNSLPEGSHRDRLRLTCTNQGNEFSWDVYLRYTHTITNIGEIPPINRMKAWGRNGKLHVTGVTVGETLSVYNATGALVYHRIATSDEMDIDLTVSGVYIVRNGNNTVKVPFLR